MFAGLMTSSSLCMVRREDPHLLSPWVNFTLEYYLMSSLQRSSAHEKY